MSAAQRIYIILLITLTFIMLTACSSITRAVLPEHRLVGLLEASKTLNPNENGLPSPLSVYFFQVKEADSFNNAEFFDLYDKGKETLGGDFLALSKVNLLPSTTARLTLALKPEVKYVGVVAAYRQMDGKVWRVLIPIDFSWGRKKVRLQFTQRGILVDSALITGSDININKPNLDKPNTDDWLKPQVGPDMNFEIIKQNK